MLYFRCTQQADIYIADAHRWPYRLAARTTGFQSVNQGSIPCRATRKEKTAEAVFSLRVTDFL